MNGSHSKSSEQLVRGPPPRMENHQWQDIALDKLLGGVQQQLLPGKFRLADQEDLAVLQLVAKTNSRRIPGRKPTCPTTGRRWPGISTR